MNGIIGKMRSHDALSTCVDDGSKKRWRGEIAMSTTKASPLHCTVFERYEIKKIGYCNFIAPDENLEHY